MYSAALHTSKDPRPHVTVSASTESMRANWQSIVHHIYFDRSKISESNPVGVYIGHTIDGSIVSDPVHVRNSYDTARVRRSLFDDSPSGQTAVGFAAHLKSYYVLDATGQNQQLVTLLPHPAEPDTWFFTDPNTNQSTIALFPTGCGIPLPSQLPSTPEPDDPAPATIPTYWKTPAQTLASSNLTSALYNTSSYTSSAVLSSKTVSSATGSTLPLLSEDTPFVKVTMKNNFYRFVRQDGKHVQSVASDWEHSTILYQGQSCPCIVYTGKTSGNKWWTWDLPESK